DRGRERRRFLALDRAGAALWREPGVEQGLADIDVAQARNEALIGERGFERRLLPLQFRFQRGAVEFGGERLGTDRGEELVLWQLALLHYGDEAEAARIVERHTHAVVHRDRDVVVRAERARVIVLDEK